MLTVAALYHFAPLPDPAAPRRLAGKDVHPVGLGCMNIVHGYSGFLDDDAAVDLLTRVLEDGTDHLDTATLYGGGRSEELVGRALARAGSARIEAEASAPAAQEAHAHGVEGAEHESARAVRADHRLEARAHLVRGAVRERDDDAPLRRDRRRAVAYEPRHARREHARLAGPGAREDLQGPRGVGRHRRVLGGGQHVERGTGRPVWVGVEP